MHTPSLRPTVLVALYSNRPGKLPAIGLVEPAKHPDSFIFLQGGIEAGESPEAAAYRELSEELGLRKVDVGRCIRAHPHPLPPDRWHGGVQGKLLHLVPARVDTMGIRPANGENTRFAWAFGWDHLFELTRYVRPEKRDIMFRALVWTGLWPVPDRSVAPETWALTQAYAST